MSAILDIQGLSVGFDARDGFVQVLDGVDIAVEPGQIVGLVGESGSGKSTTPLAAMGLLPANARVSGQVHLDGSPVEVGKPALARAAFAGQSALIFQQPMKSFSPYYTFERQMVDAIVAQTGAMRGEARDRALSALEDVHMPDPHRALSKYPHQVSGGQAQRFMIALALSCEPRLLIADEPTTALDVTVQAQVLHLIREQANKHGIGVLLITHDMGVVAEMCDRTYVLYSGRCCEQGTVSDIFHRSRHRYTQALLASMPRLGGKSAFETIAGTAPSPRNRPPGCAFHPRCGYAIDACKTDVPFMSPDGATLLACHNPADEVAS